MEFQAVLVNEFTVAGELSTTLFFCPLFAFSQKLRCISALTIFLSNKYPFQISDGRALSTFNIIITKLALSKSDRLQNYNRPLKNLSPSFKFGTAFRSKPCLVPAMYS